MIVIQRADAHYTTKEEVPDMYHIIVNPASRSGKGWNIWKRQIEPALAKEQVSYRSYLSEKPGDVARIAREISTAAGNDTSLRIIVLGGDGTVNETLQGIEDTSHLVLGYIPTGSSNDLARDLKIPKKPLDALHRILHTAAPTPMDLGRVTYSDGEMRRFLVSCGIGYDAAVCEKVGRSSMKNTLNKIGLGKLIYLVIALRTLFRTGTVPGTLALDHGTPVDIGNILFIACMLHRFEGGGFMFAPKADAHDGMLNLCAVGNIPKPLILFALPTAFFGKHYLFKGITPYTAKDIVIESAAPLWVHTDGEVTRKDRRITVSCQKDAFSMLL